MRIVVASKVSDHALDRLRLHHHVVQVVGRPQEEVIDAMADCEALVFRSGVDITASVIEAAPALRLMIRAGSGFDNVDLEALSTRKIRVVRIPGPGAKAVAELSLALMLALARRLFWADGHWRQGRWVKPEARGRLLHGRSLGIVGAGNIGSRTGALGSALGMVVRGCVEHPDDRVRWDLERKGITLSEFDEVLARSEFISVHVPLQQSTLGLIGENELALMPPGSFLVNLSRGGVVDEVALRTALVSGHLAGAGLDVHAVEGEGQVSGLADLDNVILTPHIGAETVDSQEEIGEIIVRSIDAYEFEPVTDVGTPEHFIVV